MMGTRKISFGELVEGGINSPSLIILLGKPGTAKFFIAVHFILEGLKNDEICAYICVNYPPEKVRKTMKQFSDVEVYEKEKRLIFVDAFTGRFGESKEEYFIEDPYDFTLYDGLIRILRNKKVDRVALESFDFIKFQPEEGLKLLKRFHVLVEEGNCLGLFIVNEGALSKDLETALRSSGDVTLHTYRKDNKFFITVDRMRMMPHSYQKARIELRSNGVNMYRF